MTSHSTAYEAIFSTSAGGGSGSLPQNVCASVAAAIVISSDPGMDVLPEPIVPMSGYETIPVDRATIYEFGDSNIVTHAPNLDTDFIEQDGALVDNSEPFLIEENAVITQFNSGRLAARIQIRFNGAARPANATSSHGRVSYAYQDSVYQGLAHFCDFEPQPPNTDADGSFRLAELLKAINGGVNTVTVGADSGGNPIIVNGCAFAAVAPEGHVQVRPEDLGDGPDLIPSGMIDNTADKFRAHPSVFFRPGRNKYVRAVTRNATDGIGVAEETGSGGPLRITNVDAPIEWSNWLIIVDGSPMVVRLDHPPGDFRRPRDIWNDVWLPILNGPSDLGTPTQFGQVIGNSGGVAGRWKYAEYFRCLPLAGTNVIQTGLG